MSPEELVAAILLTEGADQGPEGLEFIGDTMFTRSVKRKLPLDKIANQSSVNKKGVRVYQYTGAGRPDLEAFVARQPQILRTLALEIAKERMNPQYQPKYPGIENYVTKDFWENRGTLSPSHWVNQMDPAVTVGSHVGLKPRKAK